MIKEHNVHQETLIYKTSYTLTDTGKQFIIKLSSDDNTAALTRLTILSSGIGKMENNLTSAGPLVTMKLGKVSLQKVSFGSS